MEEDLVRLEAIKFFEWFRANGGVVDTTALGLRIFSDTGRGAVALRDIEEDETLFEIPRNLVLSTRTSTLPGLLGEKDWEALGVGWAGLILCMMWEEAKGAEGKWNRYFDKVGKKDAEEDYCGKVLPVIQRRPDLFPPDLLSTAYSLERYHINGSRILSRSFHVEEWRGSAMDEGSDSDESDSEEGVEDAADVGMTPLADLLNARYGCNNQARLFYEEQTLKMSATQPIAAGTQIWNTYGDPPNSDLLRRYGHVDIVPTPDGPGNPADVVEIKADMVVQEITSNPSRERLDFFLEEGGDDVFVIEATEPELPDELLSFIRLLLLSDEDFLKATQKGALPKPRKDLECLTVSVKVLEKRLSQYPTAIEEDVNLLNQTLELNARNAVVFQGLEIEDVESSESEQEEVSPSSSAPLELPGAPALPEVKELLPPKPVERRDSAQSKSSSKSAKRATKKKAAAAALAASTSEPATSTVDEASENFATSLSPGADASAEVQPPAPSPATPEVKANGYVEPTPTPKVTIPTSSNGATSLSVVSPASSGPGRARSPLRPLADATTPFSPVLPDSLPQPASPGLGPRKRKASRDLKSNPLPKESKVDRVDPRHESANGVTTAITESGEKIGVVKLKLAEVPNPSAVDKDKGKRSVITRTIWTFIMIGGFFGFLAAGPTAMIVLVMSIQTIVYREVTNLFGFTSKPKDAPLSTAREKRDPWSKTLNWYFFAVTNYFLYGESMIYYFKHVVYADVRFLPFANNHRFISFMLYIFGFMGFVGSLDRQFLKQQFGLFGWVHMSLLVIVVSSHFIVNNILEGMIWFWVPAALVICNDIFAYIWGKTFGRTQLIALSPKKTVEGFVGAFFTTLIFALIIGTASMQSPFMICPAVDLGSNYFRTVTCEPNPSFVWRTFTIPEPIQAILSPFIRIPPINWAPFQLHTLVMAVFASLVAPFGGFFASGFKRAFDLKDFGDSIPGHGGMTDRMDCQFLMGMFAYVYYSSIVRVHRVTVGSVMQTIVSSLSVEEQVSLFNDLKYYLEGLGVDAITGR
ncbi:hypothetical protein FRB99_004460 [Tulasnella sp. 403]|nr:hypothetical protein FRB99_004460 [Tulasnella sp. 403]